MLESGQKVVAWYILAQCTVTEEPIGLVKCQRISILLLGNCALCKNIPHNNFLSTLQHGKREWTAMIILMKMAMRMDWISLDVEPTWPSILRVQAHQHPSPAVWPNAKQNDDGLVFQFGRNLRAYFCLANSILTCSTPSSISLHQANTNPSSCFG